MKNIKTLKKLIQLSEIEILALRNHFNEVEQEYNNQNSLLNEMINQNQNSFSVQNPPLLAEYAEVFRTLQGIRIKRQETKVQSAQEKVENLRHSLIDQMKDKKILNKVVAMYQQSWEEERERIDVQWREEIFLQSHNRRKKAG